MMVDSLPTTVIDVFYYDFSANQSKVRTHIQKFPENDTDGNTANDNSDSVYKNNWHFWRGLGFEHKSENQLSFKLDTLGNVYLQIGSDPEWNSSGDTGTTFYLVRIRSDEIPPDTCSVFLPSRLGTFEVDARGQIVYKLGTSPNDTIVAIPCIPFCDDLQPTYTIASVVSSSATTWNDQWTYPEELHIHPTIDWQAGNPGDPFALQPASPYQKGELGKYRPEGSWVYRTDVLQSDPAGVGVHEGAGTYELTLFDWSSGAVQESGWLKTTTIATYSPSGDPIEERNILGIPSAARFDHDGILPGVVAANAAYGSVDFISFEDPDETGGLSGTVSTDVAHTGRRSLKLPSSGSTGTMLSLTVDSSMVKSFGTSSIPNGLLVRYWLKRTNDYNPPTGEVPVMFKFAAAQSVIDAGAGPTEFEQLPLLASSSGDTIWQGGRVVKIAQTGEWSLYQTYVDNVDVAALGTEFGISFEKNFGGDAWIDDVRIQPVSAQATCYVYDDDDKRLLAQFDDQHFSVRYQYSGEGKLVRRLVETERGVFTVVETHYNTPSQVRTLPTPPSPPPGISTTDQGTDVILSSTIARDAREARRLELQAGPNVTGSTIEMLTLSAGRDGVTLDLLGTGAKDAAELLRSVRDGFHPDSIDFSTLDPRDMLPGVPEATARKRFEQVMALDSRLLAMQDSLESLDLDVVSRRALEQEIARVDAERSRLLESTLGTDPAAIRSFYDRVRSGLQDAEAIKQDAETEEEHQ